MKGRKPKPIGQQIAEGDPAKRGKNKLREALAELPSPQRGYPPCPGHLPPLARSTWNFLAAQIEIMGQDHQPDALMLEGACVNYARAVKADQAIERDGITIELSTIDEDSGERILLGMKANPACSISDKAWKLVRSFCSEFGLSPTALTRLKIEKPDNPEEDLAKLLYGEDESESELAVN